MDVARRMRATGARGSALALQGLEPSFAALLMAQLPQPMVAKILVEMTPHAAAQMLTCMEQSLFTVECLNLIPSGVAANLFTHIAEDDLITTVGRAYKVDRKHRPTFEALVKESQEIAAAKRMIVVKATPMQEVVEVSNAR
jgi:flagellar motor switch protein FliG